jgi:hypothetical protein
MCWEVAQPVTGSRGAWIMRFIRLVAIPGSLLVAGATLAAASPAQAGHTASAAAAGQHAAINCE